ncbi:curved DNA-binding protein CbpA [Microbacterium testaceum]|nr:curved DNA-binding protein CbpA [Microbacterium testaceum]
MTRIAADACADHERRAEYGERGGGRGERRRGIDDEERRRDHGHPDPGEGSASGCRDARERGGGGGDHRTRGELTGSCHGREVGQARIGGRLEEGSDSGCHDDGSREQAHGNAARPRASRRDRQRGDREQHEEGPRHRELLLDGERPEVLERRDVRDGEVVATGEAEVPVRYETHRGEGVEEDRFRSHGREDHECRPDHGREDGECGGQETLHAACEEAPEPQRPLVL